MIVDDLKNFITRAEKNRKYAPNSASGLRVALRYFEQELNEEESQSLEVFRRNFSEIYQNVIRKNQDTLSAVSLEIYKKRMTALLNDYEKYSADPATFLTWAPLRRTVIRKKKILEIPQHEQDTNKNEEEQPSQEPIFSGMDMAKSEIPLRPGVKAVIWVPTDLNSQDVNRIESFLKYLSSLTEKS